jgi:hypothetical protein
MTKPTLDDLVNALRSSNDYLRDSTEALEKELRDSQRIIRAMGISMVGWGESFVIPKWALIASDGVILTLEEDVEYGGLRMTCSRQEEALVESEIVANL